MNETGTEHVAIATPKCALSGIFRRVQTPCQVSTAYCLIIGRGVLDFACTTSDVSVTKSA